MLPTSVRRLLFTTLLCLVAPSCLFADEWPQWMGPQRDGVYREQGVVTEIPDAGLPVKWRTEAAYGYAGPAVAGGKVYLFDYVITSGEPSGGAPELEGRERLRRLDAATGEVDWTYEYERPYRISYGYGPRCTPTVDGDRVYILGAEGDLTCVGAADGERIWHVNFMDKFGAESPTWGFAGHPLVDGDTLYCIAGGEGSVAVAFDKNTGDVKWRNLSAREPGYSTPTMISYGGAKQLLIWHAEAINGLNPESGELLWTLPVNPSYGMAVHAPQKAGDKLFVSAIGDVSVLMELVQGPDVEVVWAATAQNSVQSANVTPHIEDGVIYGVDCRSNELTALRLEDGEPLWATKQPTLGEETRGAHATAFLIKHAPSGGYYLFNDAGDLITARLSAEGYQETGRMHVLEPTGEAFGRAVVWSHPAFADRCVFMRNDKEIVCVDLAE